MDPYLEHPMLWPGLHNSLIGALAAQLQPLITPRYVAAVEQRVFVEGPQREVIPDLFVQKVRDNGSGLVVAAPVGDAPVVLAVEELEIREMYIEILDRYAGMQVVTVLEVISPSNKALRPGRKSYRRKQRETLASKRHLVEIDLLRRGRHVMSVPRWRARDLGPYDYLMCVNRWPQRHRFELYPRRLRERLARINVPLAEPDPDVPLDIQVALEQAYWDGRYMLRVRYDDPCEPPLSPEDQAWAKDQWAAYRATHPELFPAGAP
jgi:hypothetical protein